MSGEISFRVLGPLVVQCGDEVLSIHGRRPQTLLTMLLLEANRRVSIDRLIDAIWDESPPASARSQVRICVCDIRRRLAEKGHGDVIETHYDSYLIRVAKESLDIYRFEEMAFLGRTATQEGDDSAAVRHLRTALDEWRGPVASAPQSELVSSVLVKLDEDRYAVAEEYARLKLRLGQHREIVGDLARFVAEFPYRENICAQLMLALFKSGRKAEALDLYQQTRQRLIDDLGIEPGPELRRMQHHILSCPHSMLEGDAAGKTFARTEDGRGDIDGRLRTLERELSEIRIGFDRLVRLMERKGPGRKAS